MNQVKEIQLREWAFKGSKNIFTHSADLAMRIKHRMHELTCRKIAALLILFLLSVPHQLSAQFVVLKDKVICLVTPFNPTSPDVDLYWSSRAGVITLDIPTGGPASIQTAVMGPISWGVPELIPRIYSDILDDIIIWLPQPDVEIKAAALETPPPGFRWYGFESEPVSLPAVIGGQIDLGITFTWTGDTSNGYATESGRYFITTDADDLYGGQVTDAFGTFAPASIVNSGDLGSLITFSKFTGSGFSPNPTISQINSDYWEIIGFSDGDLNYGDFNVSGDFARGITSGNVNIGGIYGINNGYLRALMIQPTNADWSPGSMTLKLQNNTGLEVNRIELSFDMFVNNNGTFKSIIDFEYSIDNVNFIPVPELRTTSKLFPDTLGFVKVNDDADAILDGLAIPDGGHVWFRWIGMEGVGPFGGDYDEFALDNILATPINSTCVSTNPPSNPQTFVGQNNVLVSWDPIPGSIGYEIRGKRITPPGPTGRLRALEYEVNSRIIPLSALGPGTMWEWRVRSACSTSPGDRTPLSISDTIPVPFLNRTSEEGGRVALELEKKSATDCTATQLSQVKIFPNPASDRVLIAIDGEAQESNLLTLTNLAGNVVLTHRSGSDNVHLNLQHLPQGFYQLFINDRFVQHISIAR